MLRRPPLCSEITKGFSYFKRAKAGKIVLISKQTKTVCIPVPMETHTEKKRFS